MNIAQTEILLAQGRKPWEIELIDALAKQPGMTVLGRSAAERNLPLVVELLNRIGLEKSLSAHPKNLVIEIHFGSPVQAAAQADTEPPAPALPPVPSNSEFCDQIPPGAKRTGRFEVINPPRKCVI
jgi:hypothetical protein